MRRVISALSLSAVVLFAVVAGCGTNAEPEDVVQQRSNMRSLAVAYGNFTKSNRGRVPKSEKTFRAWIEKQGPDFLTNLGVENVDDIFISTRDNEPYVVVYGKQKRIVAYEKVGVAGKRFITDDLGVTQEVDEAKFHELVPDAK